jgi:hypothetical protein
MAAYQGTDIIVSSGNAFALTQSTYVAKGVRLVSTGGNGVAGTAGVVLENHGEIVGLNGVVLNSTGISIENGEEGIISALANSGVFYAIDIASTGGNFINNLGQISALGIQGVGIRVNAPIVITNTGSITSATAILMTNQSVVQSSAVYNYGTIFGSSFSYNGSTSLGQEFLINASSMRGAITFGNANAATFTNSDGATTYGGDITFGNGNGDIFKNYGTSANVVFGNGNADLLLNYGTISGNVVMGGGNGGQAFNAGIITGNVTLGSGSGTIFDSRVGQVLGTITAGSGGATILGAVNGGTIIGGTGDDILISQGAVIPGALNRPASILDGRGGTNALYGQAGFTTFVSGNATYNQIWGGFNDTVSYLDSANAGVYVDLAVGHNAYVSTTAGSNWTGTGRYEDSIVDVPNVIGSAFGDVIQVGTANDGQTHRVTGAGGADQLYSGAGSFAGNQFVYTGYSDSNIVTGYDTIVGFNIGTDKIDLSALHTDGSHLAISTAGTSNTLYVEKTAGVFNANTDLAMIVNTSTAGGLHASDFVF